MKQFFIILVLVLTQSVGVCQRLSPNLLTQPDSLNRLIKQTPQNTKMVLLLVQLANNYRFYKTDSSLILAQKAIEVASSVLPERNSFFISVINSLLTSEKLLTKFNGF